MLASLFSSSEIWSNETSSSCDSSFWTGGVLVNSARSSFETWIFSGVFLALLDGKIGTPLLDISPL